MTYHIVHMTTFEFWVYLLPKKRVSISITVEKALKPMSNIKDDESVIYVKLYGPSVPRSTRFTVMNALENYFHKYGKILDIGRLKQEYHDLGDFFIVFKNVEDAKYCSQSHKNLDMYPLNPSPHLGIYPYKMEVW